LTDWVKGNDKEKRKREKGASGSAIPLTGAWRFTPSKGENVSQRKRKAIKRREC